MTTIQCETFNTIPITKDEIYKLEFPRTGYVDIKNDSDGTLELYLTEDADETHRLLLSGGDAYNDLAANTTIFAEAKANGRICIVFRG